VGVEDDPAGKGVDWRRAAEDHAVAGEEEDRLGQGELSHGGRAGLELGSGQALQASLDPGGEGVQLELGPLLERVRRPGQLLEAQGGDAGRLPGAEGEHLVAAPQALSRHPGRG